MQQILLMLEFWFERVWADWAALSVASSLTVQIEIMMKVADVNFVLNTAVKDIHLLASSDCVLTNKSKINILSAFSN